MLLSCFCETDKIDTIMHQTIDGKLFWEKCFLQILKVVVELERNGGEFLKRPDDFFYERVFNAQDEWSTIRVE